MLILQLALKICIALSILLNTGVICIQYGNNDHLTSEIVFQDFYLQNNVNVSHINCNVSNVPLRKQRFQMRENGKDFRPLLQLQNVKNEKTVYKDEMILSVTNYANLRNTSENIAKFGQISASVEQNKTMILKQTLSSRFHEEFVDNSYRGIRMRREANDCLKTGSCEYNMDKDIPVCYCDIACNIFNDCCHNNKVTIDHFETQKISSDMKSNYTSCFLHIIADHLGRLRGYYMVSKCPKTNTNTDDEIKCSKTRSRNELPVTGKDGLTYKNEHCARCHSVKTFQKWALRYKFDCDVTVDELSKQDSYEDMIELFQSANCHASVIPPVGVPRPRVCWKQNSIPKKSEIMFNRTECLRYQNPVIELEDSITSRNIFCLDKKTITMQSAVCALPANDNSLKYSVHGLSALFDFNMAPKPNGENFCQDDKKDVTCKIDIIIQNYELAFDLKLISNASVDHMFLTRVQAVIYTVLKSIMPWEIKTSFHGKFSYNYVHFSDNVSNSPLNDSRRLTYLGCFDINATIYIELQERIHLREISIFKSNFGKIDWTYIEQYQTGTSMNNFSVTYIKNEYVTTKNYDFFNAYVRFQTKEEIAFVSRLYKEISALTELNTVETPERLKMIGLLTSNKSDTSHDCFHIVHISLNTTKILNYSFGPFAPPGKTMILDMANIEIILTCIFMGLSSVSLLFAMVIQIHLKLTQSNAGKLSQSLMVCMIFSHVLFIFGFGANDYNNVCFVIGVISHYIWLCCFTWMVIYSAMIIQVVKKQPMQMVTLKSMPLYIYIIGYGTPLLIVVPSLILDLSTQIKIGYADDVCFPSVYPTNIVVFILPVSISILMNVFVLTVAGCHVRTSEKGIEDLSINVQTRLYWPVYIRLVLFSGLSWLLGIVAEATGIDFIRFVFLCSAGLHGFFFSVSYLTSKQVRAEFKKERRGIPYSSKKESI